MRLRIVLSPSLSLSLSLPSTYLSISLYLYISLSLPHTQMRGHTHTHTHAPKFCQANLVPSNRCACARSKERGENEAKPARAHALRACLAEEPRSSESSPSRLRVVSESSPSRPCPTPSRPSPKSGPDPWLSELAGEEQEEGPQDTQRGRVLRLRRARRTGALYNALAEPARYVMPRRAGALCDSPRRCALSNAPPNRCAI